MPWGTEAHYTGRTNYFNGFYLFIRVNGNDCNDRNNRRHQLYDFQIVFIFFFIFIFDFFSGKDIYEGYGSNTNANMIETIQGTTIF